MLIKQEVKTAFLSLLFLTVLTGIIYPLLITAIAQFFFPVQANGSIIYQNNRAIGSALIGQVFVGEHYFFGRPSATQPKPYNAAASQGAVLGPTNPKLFRLINNRINNLKNTNALIPADLVLDSASGLDPDISPKAAYYQAKRIAQVRGAPLYLIHDLIEKQIKPRQFFLLGEPRINVLELNIALDNTKW